MTTTTRKPKKPQTLTRFLIANGYMAPCSELKKVLGGSHWWILASKGRGMTLDRAREKCVEAGYLIDHGAQLGLVSTSTIQDLLDLIDAEARGHKQYPYWYVPETEIDPDQEAHYIANAQRQENLNAIPF